MEHVVEVDPDEPVPSAALDHFAGGGEIRCEGVSMRLRSQGMNHLQVEVPWTAGSDAITENAVRAELERGRAVLEHLRESSERFAQLSDRPTSTALTEWIDGHRYYIALLTDAGVKWM